MYINATRMYTLFFALLAWSGTSMAYPPLSNTRDFDLDAPCARVFPLFTAEGEKAWAPGWNPEMLSGATERGSAFRTTTHHGGRETVWIVTDYQPDRYRVGYARLVRDSNIGLVDVTCRDVSNGARVTVKYTLTGLNKDGDDFVREFLADAHYERFVEEWRTALSGVLGK